MDEAEETSERGDHWRWWERAEFHGWVHTATLAVVTVLVLFVLVMGSFGNSLVLTSARHVGRKSGSYDLLVRQLCWADLLVCVGVAPLFLFTLFQDPPLPRLFCGGLHLLGSSLTLMSLLTLVAIAVRRQARVGGRVRHPLSLRHTRVVLGVVWVVSGVGGVGATLPALLGWRESYHTCQALIHGHDAFTQHFPLFFLGPVVIVSFVVITVSYVIIARAVRAQNRARVQGSTGTVLTSSSKTQNSSAWYRGRENATRGNSALGKRRRKEQDCRCCRCRAAAERESKAVTMCAVVTVTLLLCWSPLLLSLLLHVLAGPSLTLLQVKLCGIALVFLNSALDPYLYAQTPGHTPSRLGRLCWDILHCQCAGGDSPAPVRTTRAVPVPGSSLLGAHHVTAKASVPFPVKNVIQNVGGSSRDAHTSWREVRRTAVRGTPHFLCSRMLRKNRCSKSVYRPVPVVSQKGWQALIQQQTYLPCSTAVTRGNSVIHTVTHTVQGKRHHNCRAADVTTTGHKSWCRVHVPSDQSLMES
ncbi:hypothetical protein ACOMHN_028438 [Nucella lapillus]